MPYNTLELTNIGARIEQARQQRGARVPQVSTEALREWLTEAQALQRTQSSPFTDPKLFATWGGLMSGLMQNVANPDAAVDLGHLAAFLQAANRLEPGQLMQPQSTFRAVDDMSNWDDTPRIPAYDGLSLVTSRFSDGIGQAMLVNVLESGAWEPSALLAELATSQQAQSAYASASMGRGHQSKGGFVATVLAEMLCSLHHAFPLTHWRPSQTPGIDRDVYALFWKSFAYTDWQHNAAVEDAHAIVFAAALAEFPEHGVQALAFVREKNFFPEAMLDAILPLDFARMDPIQSVALVTDMLAMALQPDPNVTSVLFAQMFSEEHPELNSLVQMHFSMYPQAVTEHGLPGSPTTDYLLPAWVSICTKTPVKGMEEPWEGVGPLLDPLGEPGPV